MKNYEIRRNGWCVYHFVVVSWLSGRGSIKDRALAHLQDAGFFADPMQGAVESLFVPQVYLGRCWKPWDDTRSQVIFPRTCE